MEKEGGSGRLLGEENGAEWPAEAAGAGAGREGGSRSAHSATVIWVHLDWICNFFCFSLVIIFSFGG